MNDFTESESVGALVIIILSLLLTTSFTAARLWAKRLIENWHVEDYILLLAWATNTVHNGLLLGVRKAEMESQWYPFTELSWITDIMYSIVIAAAKVSLLLQLQRILVPKRSGPSYWTVQVCIWFNVVFYIAGIIALAVDCRPSKSIDYTGPEGCTAKLPSGLIISSVVNVLSDLVILIFPMCIIWKLHTSLKYKAGPLIIFAFGVFACASSLARLLSVILPGDDISKYWKSAITGIAELTCIILCICFPMMPKFTQLVFRPAVSSISRLLRSGYGSGSRSTRTDREGTYRSHKGADWVEIGNKNRPSESSSKHPVVDLYGEGTRAVPSNGAITMETREYDLDEGLELHETERGVREMTEAPSLEQMNYGRNVTDMV